MSKTSGALLFAQSGGPTAVINSSAAGAFLTALKKKKHITEVYGAVHGIKGVLNEDFIDVKKEDKKQLKLLKTTPSSLIGSVRYKLADPSVDDTDYKRLLEVFKKYNIRYFLYNGGNDSMDTCYKVSEYMKKNNYEVNVVGVPKTIDNDLKNTDHTPGFGSAAKYISTTVSELALDLKVYDKGILSIIEVMGRDSGFLTASAALAGESGYGADLIYLPETPFSIEKFVSDVKKVLEEKNGKCIVVVSEGIKFEDGTLVGKFQPAVNDGFNHVQMGGVCNVLKDVMSKETDVKIRAIELNIMQRCAAHIASKVDVKEAFDSGKYAVLGAVNGHTGVMVSIRRRKIKDKYKVSYDYTSLTGVANAIKTMPKSWITQDGTWITDEAINYLKPLLNGESSPKFRQGIPVYAKLKKIRVKK